MTSGSHPQMLTYSSGGDLEALLFFSYEMEIIIVPALTESCEILNKIGHVKLWQRAQSAAGFL